MYRYTVTEETTGHKDCCLYANMNSKYSLTTNEAQEGKDETYSCAMCGNEAAYRKHYHHV